ncbi:14441_t:CDS:2, partial [Cetraspora pellucida]
RTRESLDLIPITIPDNCIVEEIKLDEKYVIKSKEYLVDKLKPYEDVIDEKWQCSTDDGLCGEWEIGRVVLYMFSGGYYMGSSKSSRNFTCKIAENAECSVFALNYHLSPEHQFLVPLCDALAAAGGGLAVATALLIRDIGLLPPAGLVLWAPWVDLTNSMPSYWNPEMDKTDWVVRALNTRKLGPSSSLSKEYYERAKNLADKIEQKKPNVVCHPSFTKVPRFKLYCANEALAIPYVSPMLAESLGNLPPILCQVGSGERFLDQDILFSFRASDPNNYQLPKYATMNFPNSPFKKPTKVTLEVYDGTCHCFQQEHTINKNIPNETGSTASQETLKTIKTIAINPNCEIRDLDGNFLECLSWENIGIVPELMVDNM